MSDELDVVEKVGRIGAWWSAIFVLIGLGMMIWLGYFVAHHDWTRQLSQESRAAEWVGEKIPPRAPLKIIIKNSGCLRITRARVDDDEFMVDIQRVCGKAGDYAEFHWRMIANNFVLKSGYENWRVDEVDTGEIIEWKEPGFDGFSVDPRATEMILETRSME